ncbi:unnamed protein product [Trichobilharzia szidati]|nr:unnamed protein product [Trichobilharzia szidati]
MIEKHLLIMACVWTLFQMSYVLCKEISPAKRNELDTLIKRYSELYGHYKTNECVALLTVRSPEINWTVEDFNEIIRNTKFQVFADTTVDYLNKLKGDSNWKNLNGFSAIYDSTIETAEYVYLFHSRTVFEDIDDKMRNMKVKIDLPAVFANLVNSLRDAWTARKDLLVSPAVYYYKTVHMLENHDINYTDENITVEDWGKIIEKEFIKSREKVEQECLRMSGMQPNVTAVKMLLKKSDWKNVPKSEFGNALVQLISEVEKVEKHRIDRFHTPSPLNIVTTALDAMVQEASHDFGAKNE